MRNLNEILIPELWAYIGHFLPEDDLFLRTVLLKRTPLSSETQELIIKNLINNITFESILDIKRLKIISKFIRSNAKYFNEDIKHKYIHDITKFLDAYHVQNYEELNESLNAQDGSLNIIKDKFYFTLDKEIKEIPNLKRMRTFAYFSALVSALFGMPFLVCFIRQSIGEPCYGITLKLDAKFFAGAAIIVTLYYLFLNLKLKLKIARNIKKLTSK